MSPSALVCTDLDRTLLPNGPQPESPGARELFARVIAPPDVMLCYVTGRDRGLVDRAIASFGLPAPDYLITDVGTRVYRMTGAGWAALPEWREAIAADWGGETQASLRELFRTERDLRLQERSRQDVHKLSYYLSVHVNRAALEARVQERLRAKGVNASLIFSIDEPAGVGLLDVVPARATKLHALEFLMSRLEIPRERTIFAGDSGNDMAVLVSAVPSVLVANAAPGVRADAKRAAEAAGNGAALHLARGGLFGMNGNYAAGILEGIEHFMPWLVHASPPAVGDEARS